MAEVACLSNRLASIIAEGLLMDAEASGAAYLPPAEAPLLRHRHRDGGYASAWDFWNAAADHASMGDSWAG